MPQNTSSQAASVELNYREIHRMRLARLHERDRQMQRELQEEYTRVESAWSSFCTHQREVEQINRKHSEVAHSECVSPEEEEAVRSLKFRRDCLLERIEYLCSDMNERSRRIHLLECAIADLWPEILVIGGCVG